MSLISQELFDETVLENEDVFDLSPDEALQETLSQYSHLDLVHLLLTHPSSKDTLERDTRKAFLEALSHLKESVQENNGSVLVNNTEKCVEWLETVEECCKSQPQAFLVLLQQQEGMDTLLALFNNENENPSILLQTIQTLIVILTPRSDCREIQSQLRDKLGAAMTRWMRYFQQASSNNDFKLESLLLQLSQVSCRQNEENKKLWIKAAASENDNIHGIDVLLNIVKQQQQVHPELVIQACQLLAILCRFDDFRSPQGAAPVVSSAHENAMEFARHQAVPILYQVAHDTTNNDGSNNHHKLLAASLSALRVLAIHDDIVQTMVAVGVLDLVRMTLEQSEQDEQVCTATLGLMRNLCGNDSVKTTLCNDSVLSGMLSAMQVYSKNAILQEHGCGCMAAMALRKPKNAFTIVKSHDGHLQILSAMRFHSSNTLVQRQGALALRNLASRSKPEDGIRQLMLDAGAEQGLRQAGQHQACVDEAYAALRDLGCEAKIMKLDEAGKTVERTAMFGESKPKFRAVLEESSNAAKHG